ncbi:hypothetical protein [Neoactinobaculum massilliense]|uniref:hypothetical protein n=1 Tax=Neoactinobaculum massilliense TaxID=2364794 RepID=UPI000F528CED|nr:hypothetical protein [Neoactinobaculum massilliense]
MAEDWKDKLSDTAKKVSEGINDLGDRAEDAVRNFAGDKLRDAADNVKDAAKNFGDAASSKFKEFKEEHLDK